MELRKIEEKGKVMENSYAVFQIREAVGRSQMFFKIGLLKISQTSQETPVLESLFNKIAGLKRPNILKTDLSQIFHGLVVHFRTMFYSLVCKCYLWEKNHVKVKPNFGKLYFKQISW